MRKTHGIALVVSLVVLLMLLAIGVSAMFLSQMNLGIAENTRASAIAKVNANSGLDTVIVYLANAYESSDPASKSYPEDLSGYVPPAGYEFEVLDYQRLSATRASIRIRGSIDDRSAYHTSEAVIGARTDATILPPGVNPLFGQGLVTNGTIKFPGNAQVDINMWAGVDIDVTGAGQTTIAPGRAFVAAGSSCEIGKIECEANGLPPTVPEPDFDELRTSVIRCAFGTYSGDCEDQDEAYWTSNPPTDMCSGVTSITRYNSGVNDPPVICLPPNTSYTLNESNATVIGDRSTTVNISGDLSGVTVASGTVDLSGQSTLSGYTTIFAAQDIELRKGFSAVDSSGKIGAFLATEGDVTVRGNGGRSIYAVIWAGGTYIINGAAQTMVTNVVAQGADATGAIRANGNNGLVQQATELDNPFLPGDPGGVTTIFGGTMVESVRR